MNAIWNRRRVIGIAMTLGAILGAVLPFIIPGAAVSHAFTDIEARIGYGAFAVLVNALFGAILGWAVGSLVVYLLAGTGREDAGDRR